MIDLESEVRRKLDELNPGERRLAQLRLDRILRRRKALERFPSPGHIAKFIQPDTVQTKMMTALDQVAIAADSGFQRRWIISTPPQEGKTMRMGTAVPLWLLMRDPTRRIVVASYEQSVAGRSTLAVRQSIETYGAGYKGDRHYVHQEDQLGLILDPDRAQQTNWSLTDTPGRRNGGMVAVGVGGALTGRSADVLIIDDAVKGPQQAGSPQQRQLMWDWYLSVASTRLSPGALLVVIGTRWHEDDLIGRLIAQDEQSRRPDFHQLVIPAIAKSNDPLGRKAGEYLVSTRGRKPSDWDAIRRRVGEWVWAALYDADPHPPAGGVFQLAWIAYHRVPVAPELLRTEVFVDPADNEGDGDEAGIVTLARGVDEHFYLLGDESGHMTVGQWFRRAFLAALRHDATAIRYERSLSQLRKSGRQAWKDIRRDALKLHELDPFKKMPGKRARVADEALIHVAARQLARDDAEPEEILAMEKSLASLWPLVPKVLALPETGIPIRPITPKGTKTFRAQMVAPLHEYGKVHHVGLFPELQHQLVSWKEGLDSPDRMDAYVHGLTELSKTDAATANPAPARPVQPLPTRPSVGLGNTIRRQGESRRFR